MRRADRQIQDPSELRKIFDEARVCRVAIADEPAPYIVPLNFGFVWAEPVILYFHCATEGHKLECIRTNPCVGFELDVAGSLETGPQACDWGMRYASVIGTGIMSIITDPDERITALNALMRHYGFAGKTMYSPGMLMQTAALKLKVLTMTGKSNMK
jgi:uncharacterized protein